MAENSLVYQLNDNIQYLETLIQNQKIEPYFYFKVKIIANRNNSFSLIDKVIGIGKQFIYFFWTEDDQGSKYQALNTSKKQGYDFSLLQNPQQKLPLSKFDQITLISNQDPQFVSYIKTIVPTFSAQQNPQICKSSSILFLKSLQQFQTHCIFCQTYSSGMELLYSLQMIKSLKNYEQKIQKTSNNSQKSLLLNKSNLKLMRMICNLKFGYLDANTDNFGHNYETVYDEAQERKQMGIYQQGLTQITKKCQQYQYSSKYCIKLFFKIIDDMSKNYAIDFLYPLRQKTQNFQINGCQLVQEMFESLINGIRQKSNKQISIKNKLSLNLSLYPNLKYLNLSQNKLTDNIFSVMVRLIYPQSQNKSAKKGSISQTSSTVQPLFPSLININLSKNYISLQSSQTHKNLIIVLQNISSYVIKINLSSNMIKSLQFFEKYFIKIQPNTGSINIPAQFIDLNNNASLTQIKKQAFINSYIEKSQSLKQKYMTDIGFIINLGNLLQNSNPNIFKYTIKLKKYLNQQENQHQNQNKLSFWNHFYTLCKQFDKNLQQTSQHQQNKPQNQTSFILFKSSVNKNSQVQKLQQSSSQNKSQQLQVPQQVPYRTSTQSRQQIMQIFAKLFYLKNYKQLEIYKKQLQQQHQVSQQNLLQNFGKQWQQKKIQQKRIIQLVDQVMNFIDGKGNGIRNQSQQKLINDKIDRLVGIIRRKGLEGQPIDTIVYLKNLRDQLIEKYLKRQSSFNQINSIYQSLKRIRLNYPLIYNQLIQQVQNFSQINFKQLSSLPAFVIEEKFFQNKSLQKMDQPLYDRLKYLLTQKKLNITDVLHMTQTLSKQLKLFPTRAIRLFQKNIKDKSNYKNLIKTKQKLTSTNFPQISNKVEYIRQYGIVHYPFHPTIRAETDLSCYEGIVTCLTYPQTMQQQAISFIQIVNNFITFLYYTPSSVSQQTVTYINYIINYLNQLPLESFDDLDLRQFLIQEFYVHLMSFRPQQKLDKGLLINVMEYLTARIICRSELEKYILAYMLQNQSSNLQQTHLILNSLNSSTATSSSAGYILQRQTKISWTIPNSHLQNSFLNQGKLTIYLRLDTSSILQNSNEDEIQIQCHQSMTISQLIQYLLNQNNGYVGRLPLQRKLKGSLDKSDKQELQKYWIFQKINKANKLQYFKPYESFKYIGQIISQKFQNQNKVLFYLRKCVMSQHYHNMNYLTYELNQNELVFVFNKLVSNLQMSIELISRLPQPIVQTSFNLFKQTRLTQYSANEFICVIFAHIIFIEYCNKINKMKIPKSPSSQLNQDLIEQQKQQLLHSIVQIILAGKQNQNSESIIVNCKTFSIEQKLSIINKVKQFMEKQQKLLTTLSDKILKFINSLGDLAFCQTLINQGQIVVANNRFIVVGKLLEHTNELNQIVNVYCKLEFFLFFNQMTDLRLQIVNNQKSNQPNLFLQRFQFEESNKQILFASQSIKGDSYFLLCVYNLIISVYKNIINFQNRLLYDIQQFGLGTGSKKRNSQALEFYQNSKNNKPQSINGIYSSIQKFIIFDIIRNKQNQNYEKLSQSHSKQTLVKVQSNYINESQVKSNQIQAPQQQVNEVYSRKSSKRSLKSNKSQNNIKKSNSNNQINQNSRQQGSQSLIPSRISAYNQTNGPGSNTQLFQKLSQLGNQKQLRTQEIINIINQHNRPQQQVARSENILKPQLDQSDVIVTNQQRKSRKQMPKRRSSRQK